MLIISQEIDDLILVKFWTLTFDLPKIIGQNQIPRGLHASTMAVTARCRLLRFDQASPQSPNPALAALRPKRLEISAATTSSRTRISASVQHQLNAVGGLATHEGNQINARSHL